MEDPNLQAPNSEPTDNSNSVSPEPAVQPTKAAAESAEPVVSPVAVVSENTNPEPEKQGFKWKKLGVMGLIVAVVGIFSYFATTTLFKGDLFGLDKDEVVYNPSQIEEFFTKETTDFTSIKIADEDKKGTPFGEELIYNTVKSLDNIYLEGKLDKWFKSEVETVADAESEEEKKEEVINILKDIHTNIDVEILRASYENELIVLKSNSAKLKNLLYSKVPDHKPQTFELDDGDGAANIFDYDDSFEILEDDLKDEWDPGDDTIYSGKEVDISLIPDKSTVLISDKEQTHGPHTLSPTDLADYFIVQDIKPGKKYKFYSDDADTDAESKLQLLIYENECKEQAGETVFNAGKEIEATYISKGDTYICLQVSSDPVGGLAGYTLKYKELTDPADIEPHIADFKLFAVNKDETKGEQIIGDQALTYKEDSKEAALIVEFDAKNLDIDEHELSLKFINSETDAIVHGIPIEDTKSGDFFVSKADLYTASEELDKLAITTFDLRLVIQTKSAPQKIVAGSKEKYTKFTLIEEVEDPSTPTITEFKIFEVNEDGTKGEQIISNGTFLYKDGSEATSFIVEFDTENYDVDEAEVSLQFLKPDSDHLVYDMPLEEIVSGDFLISKNAAYHAAKELKKADLETFNLKLIIQATSVPANILDSSKEKYVAFNLIEDPKDPEEADLPVITKFDIFAVNEAGDKGKQLTGGEGLTYGPSDSSKDFFIEWAINNFDEKEHILQMHVIDHDNLEHAVLKLDLEEKAKGTKKMPNDFLNSSLSSPENKDVEKVDLKLVVLSDGDFEILAESKVYEGFQLVDGSVEPIDAELELFLKDAKGEKFMPSSLIAWETENTENVSFQLQWLMKSEFFEGNKLYLVLEDATNPVIKLELPLSSATGQTPVSMYEVGKFMEKFGVVPEKLSIYLQLQKGLTSNAVLDETSKFGPYDTVKKEVSELELTALNKDDQILAAAAKVFAEAESKETSFKLKINQEAADGEKYIIEAHYKDEWDKKEHISIDDNAKFKEGVSDVSEGTVQEAWDILSEVLEDETGDSVDSDTDIYFRVIIVDQEDASNIIAASNSIIVKFDDKANKGKTDFTFKAVDKTGKEITPGNNIIEYKNEDKEAFMTFDWVMPGAIDLEKELQYEVLVTSGPGEVTTYDLSDLVEVESLEEAEVTLSLNQTEIYKNITSLVQSGLIEDGQELFMLVKVQDASNSYISSNTIPVSFMSIEVPDDGGGDPPPVVKTKIETRTSCLKDDISFCVVQYNDFLLIGDSSEIAAAISRINNDKGDTSKNLLSNELYKGLKNEMIDKKVQTWFFHGASILDSVIKYLPDALQVNTFALKGYMLASKDFRVVVDLINAGTLEKAVSLLVQKLIALDVVEDIINFINKYTHYIENPIEEDSSVVFDVTLTTEGEKLVKDLFDEVPSEPIDPLIPDGIDEWDPEDDSLETITEESTLANMGYKTQSHGPHTLSEPDLADWFTLDIAEKNTKYTFYSEDVIGKVKFTMYRDNADEKCSKAVKGATSNDSGEISLSYNSSQFGTGKYCLKVETSSEPGADASYTMKYKVGDIGQESAPGSGSVGNNSNSGQVGGGGSFKPDKTKVTIIDSSTSAGANTGTETEQVASLPKVSLACLNNAENKTIFQDRPANPDSLEAKSMDFFASVASMSTPKAKNEPMAVGYPVAADFPNLRIFGSARDISRAEFLKLAQISNCKYVITGPVSPYLPDTTDHWAKELIRQAVSNGVVSGYLDGTFGPNNPVTRAQAIKILLEMKGQPFLAHNAALYTDVKAIDWFGAYISTAHAEGLLEGITQFNNAKFEPNKPITRIESAMLIYNMYNKIVEDQTNAGLIESSS